MLATAKALQTVLWQCRKQAGQPEPFHVHWQQRPVGKLIIVGGQRESRMELGRAEQEVIGAGRQIGPGRGAGLAVVVHSKF